MAAQRLKKYFSIPIGQLRILHGKPAVGQGIDAFEILGLGRYQRVHEEVAPRRHGPDGFLGLGIGLAAHRGIGRDQTCLDQLVHFLIGEKPEIGKGGREALGCQERPDAPVRVTRGRGPAAESDEGYLVGIVRPVGFELVVETRDIHRLDLAGDADLLELLLNHLRGAQPVGGIRGQEHDLEPIFMAGFLHQGLGLGEIVGPRALLLVELEVGGDDGIGFRGGAAPGDADDGLLVQGVIDGLAHALIGKGRIAGVQDHVALDDGGPLDDVDLGVGLDHLEHLGRHGVDVVGLAGAQHGHPGPAFRDRAEGDGVDLHRAPPVVGVLLDLHRVGNPLPEDEGAGPDGVFAHLVPVLGDGGGAQDQGPRVGDGVDKGAEGLVQNELDGCIVDDDQFLDRFHQAAAFQFSAHQAGDVHAHGFGVERGAVVKFDAFAQLEGELGGGVVEGAAFSQKGDHIQILVESHEPFEHRLLDGAGIGVRGVVGVQGLRRGFGCVDDVLRSAEGRRGQHRQAQQNQKQSLRNHGFPPFRRGLMRVRVSFGVCGCCFVVGAASSRDRNFGFFGIRAYLGWKPLPPGWPPMPTRGTRPSFILRGWRHTATMCPGDTSSYRSRGGGSPTFRIGLGSPRQHAEIGSAAGIGNGYRRQQLPGVWVLRVFKYLAAAAHLHDLPEIHDRHAVAHRSTTAMSCEMKI